MTQPEYGTADHAAMITFGRSPGVQTALAWLTFSHLPETLQGLSRPLYEAAIGLIRRIPGDPDELITALNTLVEAKDWFVRAGIHNDRGRPGSIPRPAVVIDPPQLGRLQKDTWSPPRDPQTSTNRPTEVGDDGWAGR
jgi:hypothetical protein